MWPSSWNAPELWIPVTVTAGLAIALIGWSYARSPLSMRWKLACGALKSAAVLLLCLCLLEPVSISERPASGQNLVVVLADSSRSLTVSDRGSSPTREDRIRQSLTASGGWLNRLQDDFDVRPYTFDSRLARQSGFDDYAANENGSQLQDALRRIRDRFVDRPLAGVVVLTDGNATDRLDPAEWEGLPPVYPVVVGDPNGLRDLAIREVVCSQTNFESAPVTITAELESRGMKGADVVVQLLDANQKELQRREIRGVEDGRPFSARFEIRPEQRGISLFEVRAIEGDLVDEETLPETGREATWVNNRKTVVVDRGRGPFRVLYVSGRPNWEYKFLRRAIADDHELELVALVRLARREPKFTFRERLPERSNSFFRGFGEEEDETAEQYDEPVMIRLGTRDGNELKEGFPLDAETLFEYDALILDDVEASFFTAEQLALIKRFVSVRGGGFLMLGGTESFAGSDYDRTPVGELLPVYAGGLSRGMSGQQVRLTLTREGWIQPWVRVRATEAEEQQRLAAMPDFQTVNRVGEIKPGASVLATVEADGTAYPALAVQRFGRGRAAALLIGDLWRWQLESPLDNDDLQKAWRQTLRWLVADVPHRVEIESSPSETLAHTTDLLITTVDPAYQRTDNVALTVTVTTPDQQKLELMAEPSRTEPGQFRASFTHSQSGACQVEAVAEFRESGERWSSQTGWVSDLEAEEFSRLAPNRSALETLARETGGEVIPLDEARRIPAAISARPLEHRETRVDPWWHRWPLFLLALGCLVTECGLRRWKGLP